MPVGVLLLLLLGLLLTESRNGESFLETEEGFESVHKINSFSLGISISLMLMFCVVTYLFKVYEIHWLPEPSVCLLCGLLIGIWIRYSGKSLKVQERGVNVTMKTHPDKLPNVVHSVYASVSYEYRLVGPSWDGEPTNLLSQKMLFNPEIFFYLILPPIIFNCGLKIRKRYFFRNFGAVMTMAIAGTALTMLVFSLIVFLYSRFSNQVRDMGLDFANSLMLGSIVCSTDPVSVLSVFTRIGVDIDLYSIILGESAFNDAVSLVSKRTLNAFLESKSKHLQANVSKQLWESLGMFFGVFIGSSTLGVFFACVNAVITKATSVKKFPTIETALFMLLSYSSFLVTEICGMIGIVGVLFCGMFQTYYTYRNLSYESKVQIDKLVELTCFFFENFVFCYMGITVFVFEKHIWMPGFICWSFFALMIARAVSVYLLCLLLNLRRRRKISCSFQHAIYFSGLKGAISFALALEDTSSELNRLMLTTTVVFVLVTVLAFGGVMPKLILFLKIPTSTGVITGDPSKEGVDEEQPATIDYMYTDQTWLVRKWHSFNNKYVIPFLTIEGPSYKHMFSALASMFLCCFRKSDVVRKTSGVGPSVSPRGAADYRQMPLPSLSNDYDKGPFAELKTLVVEASDESDLL